MPQWLPGAQQCVHSSLNLKVEHDTTEDLNEAHRNTRPARQPARRSSPNRTSHRMIRIIQVSRSHFRLGQTPSPCRRPLKTQTRTRPPREAAAPAPMPRQDQRCHSASATHRGTSRQSKSTARPTTRRSQDVGSFTLRSSSTASYRYCSSSGSTLVASARASVEGSTLT